MKRSVQLLLFLQVFQPLVDRVGLGSLVPVEFFGTRKLEFLPSGSALQRFEVSYEILLVEAQVCYYRVPDQILSV